MELTFKQQLILSLVDKVAIGILVLFAGYLLNKLLERYKSRKALENELAKARDAKRLDFLDRQLSQFYYPIYMRLQIDNVVWERILDRRNVEDELRRKIGAAIEKNVILPNHEEIVKIMQSNIHLAVPDPRMFQVMLQYIRHVAVFKAMRQEECHDKDPIHLGEPWPDNLFPLIKKTVDTLQDQYNQLVQINSGDSVTTPESNDTDSLLMLRQLANKYLSAKVRGFSKSVNHLNEIANELGDFIIENKISRDELTEMAEREAHEGLYAALASVIKSYPDEGDLDRLMRIAFNTNRRHVRYRITEAFGELFKAGIATANDRERIYEVLNSYEERSNDEPFIKQINVCRDVIARITDDSHPKLPDGS